jgi:DNA primase small subunit
VKKLKFRFSDIILEDQDCFAEVDGWNELMHLIPEGDAATRLRKKWDNEVRSSGEKWDDLTAEYKRSEGTQKVHSFPL